MLYHAAVSTMLLLDCAWVRGVANAQVSPLLFRLQRVRSGLFTYQPGSRSARVEAAADIADTLGQQSVDVQFSPKGSARVDPFKFEELCTAIEVVEEMWSLLQAVRPVLCLDGVR